MTTKVGLDVNIWWSREPDPDDSWDAGDRDGCVERVRIIDDNEYVWRSKETDLELPFYVVYAGYNTGSTFGRDYDATIVAIVKDEDEAIEVVENGRDAKGYSFMAAGKDYSAEWVGYFESLDKITYERFS